MRRKVKITVPTERKAKIMTKLTLFLAVPQTLLLMGSKKDIGLKSLRSQKTKTKKAASLKQRNNELSMQTMFVRAGFS